MSLDHIKYLQSVGSREGVPTGDVGKLLNAYILVLVRLVEIREMLGRSEDVRRHVARSLSDDGRALGRTCELQVLPSCSLGCRIFRQHHTGSTSRRQPALGTGQRERGRSEVKALPDIGFIVRYIGHR